MTDPQAAPPTVSPALASGQLPRVVGTLSTSIPENFPPPGMEALSDMVEIRLDQMPHQKDWLDRGRAIQAHGLSVILTLRLEAEGGGWTQPDEERLEVFEQALQHLSTVDIELRSRITSKVSSAAKRLSKVCIVSYHDFQGTPPLAKLQSVVSEAQELGSIAKVSTMINAEKDIEILQNLLASKWRVPVCIIGMGPLGTRTRVSFPTFGSCLTYGYLDRPSAPGQLPASNLVEQLRVLLPKYNASHIARKQPGI